MVKHRPLHYRELRSRLDKMYYWGGDGMLVDAESSLLTHLSIALAHYGSKIDGMVRVAICRHNGVDLYEGFM